MSASPARGRRAIEALRPRSQARQGSGPLPDARYPRYYLDQLRRVAESYDRGGTLRAVRDELRISRSAVRFELALARELGPTRLRLGRPSARSLEAVKSDLARRRGVEQRDCELEPAPA